MGPMDVAVATARAAVATIGEILDDVPLGAAVAAVVTAAAMAGVQEVSVLPHFACQQHLATQSCTLCCE